MKKTTTRKPVAKKPATRKKTTRKSVAKKPTARKTNSLGALGMSSATEAHNIAVQNLSSNLRLVLDDNFKIYTETTRKKLNNLEPDISVLYKDKLLFVVEICKERALSKEKKKVKSFFDVNNELKAAFIYEYEINKHIYSIERGQDNFITDDRMPKISAGIFIKQFLENSLIVEINNKFNIIDNKLDKIDKRFDKLETRVSKLETSVSKLETNVNKRFDEIDKRFDRLEQLIQKRN